MQKFYFCLLILLQTFYNDFGQCPLIKQWDKRYGGNANEWLTVFKQRNDGGFIIGGTSVSSASGDMLHTSNGNKDFWVVQTDTSGNITWEKNYGGTSDDELTSLLITTDGGYLLGGITNSPVSGDVSIPGFGFFDYWIVRIDSNGNKMWDGRFGGSEIEELTSLGQVADGGFVLAGSSLSGASGIKTQPSWGMDDYWIVKTDSLGLVDWEKRYGGNSSDKLFSVKINSKSEILLGGSSGSGISGDKTQISRGLQDYWIIKTDSAGNILWDKRFGGTNDDSFCTLDVSKKDEIALAGFSQSGVGGDKSQPLKGQYDFWILNLDSAGNLNWDKDFGGLLNDEFTGSISFTTDGGLLIAGTSYSNAGGDKTENNLSTEQMWIIKTDSNGIKSWDKTIQNISAFDDEAAFAMQTIDGGYAIANYTFAGTGGDKTDPSQGGSDYWLLKFRDSTGVGIAPSVNLLVSDTVFCGKKCLDFTDLSMNNPTSWFWMFPGGTPSSSTDQNPQNICYNSFGIFDVKLVVCNGAGCDSIFLPGFIRENQNPPVPVISYSLGTLIASPSYSYSWYNSSNPATILSADSFFVPLIPGNYFVIACDSNSCCTSSSVFILAGVNQASTYDDHLIVSMDHTMNTLEITTVGIYANEIIFRINNLLGQNIETVTDRNIYGSYSRVFSLNNYTNGIYILSVLIDRREIFKKKIMK